MGSADAISAGVYSSLRDESTYLASGAAEARGLFVMFTEKGPDGVLNLVTGGLPEYKKVYGKSKIKYGQNCVNAEKFFEASPAGYVLRVVADDAAYGNQMAKIVQVNKTVSYKMDAVNPDVLTPVDNEVYFINGTGLNDFAGMDYRLATYFDGDWSFSEVALGTWLKNEAGSYKLRSEDGVYTSVASLNGIVNSVPDVDGEKAYLNDYAFMDLVAAAVGGAGDSNAIEIVRPTTPGSMLKVSLSNNKLTVSLPTDGSGNPVNVTADELLALVQEAYTLGGHAYLENVAGGMNISVDTAGVAGNSKTLTIQNGSGVNIPLSVSMVGNDIVVTLPTDGAGSPVPTAVEDVVDKINPYSQVPAQAASLVGFAGAADITAATPGAAGNNISIAILEPGKDDATVSTSTTGTDIKTQLARSSNVDQPISYTDLSAQIDSQALVSASVNAGASGSTTINSAVSPVTLSGGADAIAAVAASLSNFAGGVDLSAETAGVAGNNISVEVQLPTFVAVSKAVNGGDLTNINVVLERATNGIVPITFNQLVSDLNAIAGVSATLNAGAVGTNTVSNAVSQVSFTGGVDAVANVQSSLNNFAIGGNAGGIDFVAAAGVTGTAGDAISVEFRFPGSQNDNVTVNVVGNAITVNCKVDAGGSPIATSYQEILTALAGSGPATALVVASMNAAGNSTDTISTGYGPTNLAGGVNAVTAVSASAINFAGGIDLVADASGVVGNTYTVRIDLPTGSSAAATFNDTGFPAVVVTLARDANFVTPMSFNTLQAGLDAIVGLAATVNAGAVGTNTISTAFTATNLSGGADAVAAVSASVTNFAGGVDVVAATPGVAGNSITVSVIEAPYGNRTVSFSNAGAPALTVTLGRTGNVIDPLTYSALVSGIDSFPSVSASLTSGASGSAVITAAVAASNLSGGAEIIPENTGFGVTAELNATANAISPVSALTLTPFSGGFDGNNAVVATLNSSYTGSENVVAVAEAYLDGGVDTLTDGSKFLIWNNDGSLASGDWEGKDGQIAIFTQTGGPGVGQWSYYDPKFWEFAIGPAGAIWQHNSRNGQVSWANRTANPGLQYNIVIESSDSPINTDAELALEAAQSDVLWVVRGIGRGSWYNDVFLQFSKLVSPDPFEKGRKLIMTAYSYSRELDDIYELESYPMSLDIEETDVTGESINVQHTIDSLSSELKVETNNDTLNGAKLAAAKQLIVELVEFGKEDASITDIFTSASLTTQYSGVFTMAGGSDGAQTFNSSGSLDWTSSKVKNALIWGFQGLIDSEITNVDGPTPDLMFDGNFPLEVKVAAYNLAINRDDCMCIMDMGHNNTVQQALSNRKNYFSFNDFHSAIYDNSSYVYNPDDGLDIRVTATYHMAYIFPRSDQAGERWFAAAGLNRGTAVGAKSWAYNPNKTQRDELYLKQINPFVKFETQTAMWQQLTTQQRSSAMQDVNIVRLYLYMKREISRFCKFYIYEQNDAFTWNEVNANVTSFLSTLVGRRGLESFSVAVSATAFQKKRKEFSVDIVFVPVRTVEKIFLNFTVR